MKKTFLLLVTLFAEFLLFNAQACTSVCVAANGHVLYSQELNEKMTRYVYRQMEQKFGPFTDETLKKIFNYPATTSCNKK